MYSSWKMLCDEDRFVFGALMSELIKFYIIYIMIFAIFE